MLLEYKKPSDPTFVYTGELWLMHIDIYTRIQMQNLGSPGQGTPSESKN